MQLAGSHLLMLLQTQELLLDVPWGPAVLSLKSCRVAVSDTHEVRLEGTS